MILCSSQRHERMIYRVAPVHDLRYVYDWLCLNNVIRSADIHKRPLHPQVPSVDIPFKNVFSMRYFDAVPAFEYLQGFALLALLHSWTPDLSNGWISQKALRGLSRWLSRWGAVLLFSAFLWDCRYAWTHKPRTSLSFPMTRSLWNRCVHDPLIFRHDNASSNVWGAVAFIMREYGSLTGLVFRSLLLRENHLLSLQCPSGEHEERSGLLSRHSKSISQKLPWTRMFWPLSCRSRRKRVGSFQQRLILRNRREGFIDSLSFPSSFSLSKIPENSFTPPLVKVMLYTQKVKSASCHKIDQSSMDSGFG